MGYIVHTWMFVCRFCFESEEILSKGQNVHTNNKKYRLHWSTHTAE
jgi:hypothetical protein